MHVTVILALLLGATFVSHVNAGSCTNASGLETAQTTAFIVFGGAGITATGGTNTTFLTNGFAGEYPLVQANICTDPKVVCTNVVDHGADIVAQAVSEQIDCILANGMAKGPRTTVGTATMTSPKGPGVYFSGSTLDVTGELVLDGGGDPNAVFVFQATSSLTTASNSRITLTNGAQACNVFWILLVSGTLGSNTTFVGTVYAGSSITTVTATTVVGRLFAHTGALTLGATNVTAPNCTASGGSVLGCNSTTNCGIVSTISPSGTTSVSPTSASSSTIVTLTSASSVSPTSVSSVSPTSVSSATPTKASPSTSASSSSSTSVSSSPITSASSSPPT